MSAKSSIRESRMRNRGENNRLRMYKNPDQRIRNVFKTLRNTYNQLQNDPFIRGIRKNETACRNLENLLARVIPVTPDELFLSSTVRFLSKSDPSAFLIHIANVRQHELALYVSGAMIAQVLNVGSKMSIQYINGRYEVKDPHPTPYKDLNDLLSDTEFDSFDNESGKNTKKENNKKLKTKSDKDSPIKILTYSDILKGDKCESVVVDDKCESAKDDKSESVVVDDKCESAMDDKSESVVVDDKCESATDYIAEYNSNLPILNWADDCEIDC